MCDYFEGRCNLITPIYTFEIKYLFIPLFHPTTTTPYKVRVRFRALALSRAVSAGIFGYRVG